jgi:hypothetical protein
LKWFLGSIFSIVLGAPLYLPWVLARVGIYKRWYLAPFMPPLMWSRAIYAWPASALFITAPLVGLLPIDGDARGLVLGIVSMLGVVLAIVMILWTPGWAKPDWQRYLEDNYPWWEIRRVFIPAWQKMDRAYWSKLMDSEEGIEELVRMAREEV